jgi:hypothetical protein
MKKIVTLLVFLFCLFVNAQQTESLSIDWVEKKTYPFSEFSYVIPQFSFGNFNFDVEKRRILYINKINLNSLLDESSLKITNVVFESITEADLGDLDKSNIKNDLNAIIKNEVSRDQIIGIISFSPIRDGSGYKRVISLNYSFDFDIKKSIKTTQSVSSITNSVLATGTWKRFYIQKSGVYKLTKSFLSDLGFSMNSVDPRKIQIYGNGGTDVAVNE